MELNISELDDVHFDGLNTMNPYETIDNNSYQDQNNYWEQPKTELKKKKVSFNDILTNMNLVVNKNGVLQFMTPNHNQEEQLYNDTEYLYSQNQNRNIKNTVNTNSQPLDHTVKHSYIYNKYFKDYVDPNIEKQGPRIPKTWEEYHQMLLEDKIKALEHKKMIEQVKSKKMLFTVTPGTTINPRYIQPTKNNLRRMTFN
jgi:hypothetical protein